MSSERLIHLYAQRLSDTPTSRAALATILSAAVDPDMESHLVRGELTQELLTAYRSLFEQAGLGLEGALGAPGSDQATFDPAAAMKPWLADAAPIRRPRASPSAGVTGSRTGWPRSGRRSSVRFVSCRSGR